MKDNNAFLVTFPVTLLVTFVTATILVFALGLSEALSFALGSITTLMMMSMLHKSTNSVLEETDKVRAQRRMARNYAFRYFFYAVILVISAIHPALNVLLVAIGLFVFKICLYIILLIQKKGGDQND